MTAAEEFVSIAEYPTESQARGAATSLVECGIGAAVAPAPPPELPMVDPDQLTAHHDSAVPAPRNPDEYAARFHVRVMCIDARRACELLGVEPPAEVVADADEEPPGPPWKKILLIWAAALVIVPVMAFLLTVWILSR
jgi:hypothetical protein